MADNNNKRLAKNTVILYIRTIITLVISLYSSRVILEVLGVEDYGIYTVVGGFVSLFAIVSQTMVAATQRYLTFELGKIEDNHLREIYSTSLLIHILLAGILILLFETIGLWFLNSGLNITSQRLEAANWIYQFSVFTFLINIIRAPFEASIIAHEKMTIYAYANILESVLKLLCLFVLSLVGIDKLVQYGFYIMAISVLVFFIYYAYCKQNFDETSFYIVRQKSYYKEMVAFAGYNFIGSGSAIIANQGLNIVLNVFFGVIVNAARGIAIQVSSAISKFVSDFTVALNPQITKSYASGDLEYTMSLVSKGSKFAYYLYLFFCLPVLINTPYILGIWLKNVPSYTVDFVRWTLVTSLINTYANPLTTCAFATGKIKNLSLWLGCLRIAVVPVVFLAFSLGLDAIYAYVVCFISDFILLFVRLSIVCKLLSISILHYLKSVILNTWSVSLLIIIPAIGLHISFFKNITISIFIFETIILLIFSTVLIYSIGLNSNERKYIISIVNSKIKK